MARYDSKTIKKREGLRNSLDRIDREIENLRSKRIDVMNELLETIRKVDDE